MLRRQLKKTAAILSLCTAMSLFPAGTVLAEEPYLKSATYYSDDWVINFWNLESNHMEEELAQIAQDGFNSIILAVPWREFQSDTSTLRYNTYALDKMDRVMEEAGKAGLKVILRVGYTWDHAGKSSVLERYQKLLYDETVQKAWLDYVDTIYRKCSQYSNFYGGFLTWEDFWNFAQSAGTMGNTQESRRLAQETGYTDYLKDRYSLQEVEEIYGEDFSSWDRVYLPERDQPAYWEFFAFYDEFLNRLLAASQTVFPNLSMEVRADVDSVQTREGTVTGYAHGATFGCQDASYTALMYAVSMGIAGDDSGLTADQVLPQTASVLDWVRSLNGGKPLYIDQFLFTDNTPGFEENPRLREEEIPLYLAGAADVLRGRTMGYGIWTYRDYGNNMLYNPQFALEKDGWTTAGGTSVVQRNGSNQMELGKFGRISQELNPQGSSGGSDMVYVRLDADSPAGANLTIRLGDVVKTVAVKGQQEIKLEFAGGLPGELSITADDRLYLDNIQAYTYITEGKLYDIDGNEESCIEAIRILNQNLQ